MALFTEDQLRRIGRSKAGLRSATIVLSEERKISEGARSFDVFLSHSIKDAEIILGIKALLEQHSLSVYVDWIDDPGLERHKVTAGTAEQLRVRMKQSKSLIYAHSINSPDSKWMPWELGFFDGYRGVIAIFPVAKTADATFKGQEFLGIYPYIDGGLANLWVNRGSAPAASMGTLTDQRPFKPARDWLRERAGV